MKNVMLLTYKNSILREKLAGAGFSVMELQQPISEHDLASLLSEKKHIDYLAVVELIDENIDLDIVDKMAKHFKREDR